jgi:hypothetical protein
MLLSRKRLQGIIAAHPRGDQCVQQVAREEDWAFSRDLLKRTGSGRTTALAADNRFGRQRRAPGRGRVRDSNPRDSRQIAGDSVTNADLLGAESRYIERRSEHL